MTDTFHKNHKNTKSIDFQLMRGGLLYQFYLRVRLQKPPQDLVKRRVLVITLLSWLPLMLLAFLDGTALSGVKVPFLFDIDAHMRFLVSLGMLIAAEVIAERRLQVVVNQFIERNIITADIRPKYDNIIDSALKLSNSTVAEILLLILVYTLGHYIWTQHTALSVSTWYATIINGHSTLTTAGYWYLYFSLPIFQFILLRWYYRIFIWSRFLWQVSRLPLHVNCLHPDHAGGLGFLNMSVAAFKAVLLAHTLLLTGLIANRIWHAGQTLPEFKLEIVSILAFLVILVLIPLIFFILPLARSKRKGLIDYGDVACDYVNDFHSKWIKKQANNNEILLGNSDIQSLADLSNSFNVANEMRLVPFSRNSILELVLLISFPLLPLSFTIIPLTDMIEKVIKILL